MAGIISVIIGIINLIVGFRFVFLLIGANPLNVFVSWVYDLSGPLVAPFSGIFGGAGSSVVTQGLAAQSVFEWASLIALLVYGIIGSLIVRLAGRGTYHRAY